MFQGRRAVEPPFYWLSARDLADRIGVPFVASFYDNVTELNYSINGVPRIFPPRVHVTRALPLIAATDLVRAILSLDREEDDWYFAWEPNGYVENSPSHVVVGRGRITELLACYASDPFSATPDVGFIPDYMWIMDERITINANKDSGFTVVAGDGSAIDAIISECHCELLSVDPMEPL